MLQVARLAPNLLHEAADKVVEFLHGELNEDGGGRDRAGKSDLYYTAFALDALFALRADLPRERVIPYLESFGDGASLDLVHRACLARSWAAVGASLDAQLAARLLDGVERNRSADGGYASRPGAANGTVYSAFLALGVYQDLGTELPEPERLAHSIERLRADDGGYADSRRSAAASWPSVESPAVDPPRRVNPGFSLGTTPTTAAAITLLRQLGRPVDPAVGRWMLARAHAQGGFLAVPEAPIPDLLSTATALHALASLDVSFEAVRERCLDFVDTLWTGRAFCGNWHDDEVDCEYAFYALLALGHLSL